jgi:hypothetical protein
MALLAGRSESMTWRTCANADRRRSQIAVALAPSLHSTSTGGYYLSSYQSASTIYCADDSEWRGLSKTYLRHLCDCHNHPDQDSSERSFCAGVRLRTDQRVERRPAA